MLNDFNKTNQELPSEKSFGLVFSIVFLIVYLYPFFFNKSSNLWALFICIIFLLLAFFYPKALKYPNKIWYYFGLILGFIVSPIVLALIYFTTVVPTGLTIRFFNKDIMKLKINKNINSYWNDRTEKIGTMKNQY